MDARLMGYIKEHSTSGALSAKEAYLDLNGLSNQEVLWIFKRGICLWRCDKTASTCKVAGYDRKGCRKHILVWPSWFAVVHAAVPFIAMLRKSVLMPKSAMAFTIAASVLGQVIGSRAERFRLKAVAAKKLTIAETSSVSSVQLPVVNSKDRHCGDTENWNAASLQLAKCFCYAGVQDSQVRFIGGFANCFFTCARLME